MSLKRIVFLASTLILLCIGFMSCSAGLGEVVDIEGPEIYVNRMTCIEPANGDTPEMLVEKKSFATTLYTKKAMTFYGEAYDNIEVTNVTVSVKWGAEDPYELLKSTTLVDNKWEFALNFEREGACWLKFTAEDKYKNYSTKCEKIVTLFVDESAPVGDSWYIDRQINGIQYNFQTLDSLKSILTADPGLTEPSHIDVAQNDKFMICATFADATGIADGLFLSLYNENGEKIVESIKVDESTASNYSPKFSIVGKNYGLPESGLHYYQIRYTADDLVSNPKSNNVSEQEVEMGWFVWWPESDNPKCSIANYEQGKDSMTVSTGDSLNITVFDDDALSGIVKCSLTGKETIVKDVEITQSTTRETNIIIKTPDITQSMQLHVEAEDIYGNKLTKDLTVYVSDDTKPNLIVTEPENNQIPDVSGNNLDIHFSGFALDKTVSSYVEFVWVPDAVANGSEQKETVAKNWLDEIAANKIHNQFAPEGNVSVKVTEGTGNYAGCKLWSAKLTDNGYDSSFRKYSYDFNISLLNDFGSEKKIDKTFIGRVTREDGVSTDVSLKLSADNVEPEIIAVNPSKNMDIIDQDSDLYIKFRGYKSNGTQIDTSKYKLSYVQNDGIEVVLDEAYYDSAENVFVSPKITSARLAEFTANNIIPKYKYYVEDMLGNSHVETYQFIISSLPQIKSVTSSAPEKCKTGQEIDINVTFSKTVTLPEDKSGIKLKLKGISNTRLSKITSDVIYADYKSGSGSTTLVFSYVVKADDVSSCLEVFNEASVGPITGIEETLAHLTTLNNTDNLQAKRTIQINAIPPKLATNGITVSASGTTSDNVNNGLTYLNAGKKIVATVKTDKKVTVQGSPKFVLKGENTSIDLTWQSISADGTVLTFTRNIESGDVNGVYKYIENSYLTDYTVIKDEFGNEFDIGTSTNQVSSNLVIDTSKPARPTICKERTTTELEAKKYNGQVKFDITNGTTEDGTTIEYMDYLASPPTWTIYPGSAVTVTKNASLVARITDLAGNVSEYSNIINVEINNTFPTYTVECTNGDGNYGKGTVLQFKVYFAEPVNIPSNSDAYITLSANENDATVGQANIKASSVGNGVTEAVFEYTTTKNDNFHLKIKADSIKLTNITDQYGNSCPADRLLGSPYVRENLYCDSIVPYVVKMTPQGTKTTQNSLNAYNNAKQIKLEFNEPVSVVSGNIYLRQTAGWAIPPMFTADEFNTVLSAANAASIDTSKTNTLTASKVLYMDGLEDAENLYSSLVGAANDRYHGTAQYVGPYKKMTNGINSDGTPNLDVKYVLDFGVDIWDSSKSTKKNFGLTFVPNWSPDGTKYTYITYHKVYQSGWVNVLSGNDINEHEITTDTIRYVLEKANLHQRYMAVNSSYVQKDASDTTGKTYILTFPEGLLGDSDLPLGREWELVIEKGAFMDETGNYFGYTYNSSDNLEKTNVDIVQRANNGTTDGTWARKRTTVTNNVYDSVKPLVLIQDGNNASFMSAGVAKPVIRVDRYSYGLGINQPKEIDANGNITYEQITSIGDANNLQTGITAPTAKVAVKIDCESKAASIRYLKDSTTGTVPSNVGTEEFPTKAIFLTGSGDITKAFIEYITADATVKYISAGVENTDSSIKAKEGVFQTIVNFDRPNYDGNPNSNQLWNAGAGKNIVNIHGTTGTGGVPSITPYPLRDQPVASAYMRQTYKNSNQYYWVSYEILKDGIYSMYTYGKCSAGSNVYATDNSTYWSDWSPNYGQMKVGEFNKYTSMVSYTKSLN